MQTTIRKWGNSLAVRIPCAFARQANLSDGTPVDLSIEDGNRPGSRDRARVQAG